MIRYVRNATGAALLAGALAFGAQAAPPESGFVFTAEERGNSIGVVDLSRDGGRTVPVGIAPHDAQMSADGRRLLATGPVAAEGYDHGHAHGREPGPTARVRCPRGGRGPHG